MLQGFVIVVSFIDTRLVIIP